MKASYTVYSNEAILTAGKCPVLSVPSKFFCLFLKPQIY